MPLLPDAIAKNAIQPDRGEDQSQDAKSAGESGQQLLRQQRAVNRVGDLKVGVWMVLFFSA